MTLDEFLLARIAEDEAQARRGFAHPGRWITQSGIPDGVPNGISCTAVLAECAAKRLIVGADRRCFFESTTCGDEPLRALATVYADHPDYRQEWAL